MDGRPLLLIGVVLLAGCAMEPLPDATPTPIATPSSSPPPASPSPTGEPIPPPPFADAREIFYDPFDADPRTSGAWRIGTADEDIRLDGAASWAPGAVRLAVKPLQDDGLPPAYGLVRDVELGPDGAVYEVRVRGHTIYRYGIYLANADGEKTSIEMDRDWFCLCATGPEGWRTSTFLPNVVGGQDYHLRLEIHADGSADASVFDQGMMPLATHHEAGLMLKPSEVRHAGIAVWVDDRFSAASDYTTFYARLTQT